MADPPQARDSGAGATPPTRNCSALRIYDAAVVKALIVPWQTPDRVCGRRLRVLLPALLDALERFGHLAPAAEVCAKLLAISAATIDRVLTPAVSRRRRRVGATAGRTFQVDRGRCSSVIVDGI